VIESTKTAQHNELGVTFSGNLYEGVICSRNQNSKCSEKASLYKDESVNIKEVIKK